MIFIRLIAALVLATTLSDAVRGEDAPAADTYSVDERNHWSFRPVERPAPPQFADRAAADWIRTPVDAFILEAAKLRPAPEADRTTLIRRLTFDLTGLPPTPAEIDAFLGDANPGAYERLVDRLLASPHYGERWGQHWLDVVRFAESEGFEYDRHLPDAWRFRDYVIDSLNADKPFDRFILEQLAGDELAPEDRSARVAVGFYRLGPVRRNAGNAAVAFSRNEVLTERIDTVGVAFLGLTVGCARCHDHMFDPFKQRDYYRLQAFLASTHEEDISLADATEVEQHKQASAALNAEIHRIKDALETADGASRRELEGQLRAANERLPAPLPGVLSMQHDESRRVPVHVLKRGDEEKPLEQVGMRVPGVFLPEGAPELEPTAGASKLLLARWIASADNPLTARVVANRLWLNHFGQGIVATPNDFGVNGARPVNPELLDYLASELMANGWRWKPLHRLIVLSAAYRQSSTASDPNGMAVDPDNRLLWHAPRRRLDAEELRDALLAVSGRLNPRAGGRSVLVPVEKELVGLLYTPSQWIPTADRREYDRRSVYLIAKRNLRLPFLEAFDQPSIQGSCPRRESSTHAPQALELLNGDLANDLARALAERLKREAGDDPERQVELGFRLVAGRLPNTAERAQSLEFLKSAPLSEFALALCNLNAFMYVE